MTTLDGLLGCINNEVKCSVAYGLDDSDWLTCSSVAKNIGLVFCRKIHPGTAKRFIETYLINNGYAELKTIDSKEELELEGLTAKSRRYPMNFFRLTQEGVNEFLPYAKYVLNMSAENGYSVASFLGLIATTPKSQRISVLKIKALEYTSNNTEDKRLIDFANSISLDSTKSLGQVLNNLNENGFVNYETHDQTGGYIKYEWNPVKKPPKLTANKEITDENPALAKEIIYSLLMGGVHDCVTIKNGLNNYYKNHDQRVLQGMISSILSNLHKKDYVKRISEFNRTKQSKLSITDKGRSFFEKFEPIANLDLRLINQKISSISAVELQKNALKSIDYYLDIVKIRETKKKYGP